MTDESRPVDELAAAYALDALEPAERARFEAEASPEALEEARQLADTAALLAADEVAPPPSLRASVLDAIALEPRHAAPSALSPPDASAAARADEPRASAAAVGPVGPAERRARARWRPARVLGAVAAGSALLLGGVAIGTQLGGDSRQEALGALIAASDAQRSEVELADGGVATVVWSPERDQSAILFDGLPAAPEGSTYQAWFIDEAGARSAGVFDASSAFLLEGELSAGTAIGVTVEPAGGSEAPTSDPILVVET
ncbi:anti-sigma factor [Agrococcus sp. Marseille-Q4369]|uniref:anti-sigma factor n=1 Tax=Agrococcus sp. Marseille-Q4369 TaxID=2810513 RepID=UPI001B8D2580|nr:anti-sigma factor [Agrococcus sp. Marseille-Q4369]QUW19421.1 anti-sigma factor [Agrococcus sp. Marseille-Q4369]